MATTTAWYQESSSTSTWTAWASDSSTTSNYTPIIWQTWTSADATTGGQHIDNTWGYWIQGGSYQTETLTYQPEGKEQKEKREAKEAEERKKREEAELKAEELLLDLIGESELSVYKETERIMVRGMKHDYLLEKKGKVTRIEKDQLADLCIAMKDQWRYPKTDNILALKLAIEADEEWFNREANEQRRYERPEILPLAARA